MISYNNQQLYVENVAVDNIAQQYGTPAYVYSKQAIVHNYQHLISNLTCAHKIFYAVKANNNLTILKLLSSLGCGFDTVSGYEIEKVLLAGAAAADIIFSGSGKTKAELALAIKHKIHAIHVESMAEFESIVLLSMELDMTVNIAIRINPALELTGHPYITTGKADNKFGVTTTECMQIAAIVTKHPRIKLIGLGCHIGSQIKDLNLYLEIKDLLVSIANKLQQQWAITLQYIDLGGGFFVPYTENETESFDIKTLTKVLSHDINKLQDNNLKLTLYLEPGRFLIANAGILISHITYVKYNAQSQFLILDAGMNDLLRPALYNAAHRIVPVKLTHELPSYWQIVGPICESSDVFRNNYLLNAAQNDVLAILNCGAYGYSMTSNYNLRAKAIELLVDNENVTVIRRRETLQDLLLLE